MKNDYHYQLHAVQNRHRRVVIMSLGRSGSKAIGFCIKHFASSESSKCCGQELLGGNALAMKDDTDPKHKIEDVFKNDDPALTGFKWKPLFFNDAYVEALTWVAKQETPVIFSTRDPLDAALSHSKHNHNTNPDQLAHCSMADEKCLEANHSVKLMVDAKDIVGIINHHLDINRNAYQLLRQLNVTFARTTYEDLLKDKWKYVMRFVLGSRGMMRRIDINSI